MKNFTYKALAVATAAVCGAGAHAGTASVSPAAKVYAVESLTSTTPVALSTVTYTMGVARASNQGFTVIVRQPAGSSTTLVCGSLPTVQTNAAGAAIVTVKRASATECAYDVDVTTNATNVVVGNQINFAGISINSHGLASAGDTEKLNIALFDTGETARVDNSTDVQVTVASSARAVSLTANADTHTQADVNFNNGNSPLFGFLAGQVGSAAVADTTTMTNAAFNVAVNGSLYNAAGSLVNAASLLTNVVVTVTGDFSGLVTAFGGAGNSSVTYANAVPSTVTPTVTYTAGGAASTAVFAVAGSNMNATGNTTVTVGLVTAGTQSLGTSRTFGVSALVNPTVGAQQVLSGNASWWTWSANAIQLASAFFNNDTNNGNLTRFFFQNVGAAASYSATCYGETGLTVTYGTARTGTLINGTTAINASDVCTFSSGKRGSIVFTINSSAGKVKGVYQQAINGASAAYIPLERPYLNGTY
jgi:hypothetical protein